MGLWEIKKMEWLWWCQHWWLALGLIIIALGLHIWANWKRP